MDNNKVRNALNELINNNTDAKDGFDELAHAADDINTRNLMYSYAKDRVGFVDTLKARLEELGGHPHKKFNILDDLHRAWIDVKVNNSDDYVEAIIEEVLRGEKIAIEDYEDILENVEMDGDTKALLIGQLAVIKERYNQLEALKR